MTRVRFALQALSLLGVFVLVTPPEYRPLMPVSVWRALPLFFLEPEAPAPAEDERDATPGYAVERTAATGTLNLSRHLVESPETGRRALSTAEELRALGARLNAIVGRARTTLNSPVPNARLRLRNTATGRIEARGFADENGQFAFLDLEPSGYIVELLGPAGQVLATSEYLPVSRGDLRNTTVRVAVGGPVLLAAHYPAGGADDPVALAESQGVTRLAQPLTSISPQR